MNWKDIKTRRQLTQYLYGKLSSGAWGSCILPNFDSPENWTDEPVSEMEVAAEIRECRRAIEEGDEGSFDISKAAANTFERLISEYVNSHSGYQYPPRTRHPAILALGSDIQSWLIERLGATNYLNKLVDAAKSWFPPGCDRREFSTFCIMFEGHANVGWGNFPEYRPISDRYVAWMHNVRTRNMRRFLVEDLRETQRENFAQDFSHLVMMCSRRFMAAAELLGVDESVISVNTVAELGVNERVDVTFLKGAASELWERFVQIYDQPQQGDLFKGWPDRPEGLWNRYFHGVLMPILLLDAGVVRGTLNATGALPIKTQVDASEALRLRFSNIPLPSP